MRKNNNVLTLSFFLILSVMGLNAQKSEKVDIQAGLIFQRNAKPLLGKWYWSRFNFRLLNA